MDRPFERVWAWVRRVPRGRVVTYGQLSLLIGRRLTPVGVGWAMHAAPPDVPWYRVVNGRGGVSVGDGRQRARLEAEGVEFGRDGRIALGEYQWRPKPKKTTRR
jgi:methylated-DNA-protein-cysteine methyltransferase-like protein